MSRGEIEPGKAQNIGFCEQVARKVASAVLSPTLLRSEITRNDDSIEKAKETLRNGKGLIVIINHFSLKDPPLAANEIFRQREMDSKKIIAPIAYHMNNPAYQLLVKLLGVNLIPIVTENTVREGKNDGHALDEGKGKYIKDSLDLLRQGGIVVLAPQGSRQGYLGQPGRSIASLMFAAKRGNVKDFSFLFIGFGIKGADDYSGNDVRGFNPFKKYSIKIGACLTKNEVMEKAGVDFRNVDRIAYEELGRVVPTSYK